MHLISGQCFMSTVQCVLRNGFGCKVTIFTVLFCLCMCWWYSARFAAHQGTGGFLMSLSILREFLPVTLLLSWTSSVSVLFCFFSLPVILLSRTASFYVSGYLCTLRKLCLKQVLIFFPFSSSSSSHQRVEVCLSLPGKQGEVRGVWSETAWQNQVCIMWKLKERLVLACPTWRRSGAPCNAKSVQIFIIQDSQLLIVPLECQVHYYNSITLLLLWCPTIIQCMCKPF